MSRIVDEYLEKKRAERKQEDLKERNRILIEEGLFEKEYSENTTYSQEYNNFENGEENHGKYYKKVAVEVSDAEYEEIKKYRSNNKAVFGTKNEIATALKIIAIVVYIGAFILGIVLGTEEVVHGYYYTYTETEFSLASAIIYWACGAVSGTVLLGFSEVINLLEDIKNK